MSDDSLYSQLADSINSAVTRRKFMQLSGIGAGSILGGSLLSHLQAIAAPPVAADEGIVVMIYMAGGCDPLNTFVPYTNNTYLTSRPNLSLSPTGTGARQCLDVNGAYGFNAALPTVRQMYLDGKLAVLPGIGYAGQDLSHFSSGADYMRGWSGSGSKTSGWLGRFLDTLSEPEINQSRGITINGTMPLALQGALSQPLSLPDNINNAYAAGTSGFDRFCASKVGTFSGYPTALNQMVARNLKGTVDLPATYRPAYPTAGYVSGVSRIESNMAISAGVINANLGARVIHVTQGGYDSHTNQLQDQTTRLAELDAAIKRFFTDLNPAFADRVTLVTYSEFGRRIQENGTGTDHGRAALMMVMGNKVNGGKILTPMPNLSAPDNNGNLIETTDFRQVYADIATNWLKTDTAMILGSSSYATLGMFTSGPGTTTTSTSTSSTTTSSTTSSTTTTTQPATTSSTTTTTRPPTTTTTTTQPPTTTTTTTRPPTTTTTTTQPPTTTTTRPATTTTTTTRPATTTTTTTRPATTTTTTQPPTTTTTRPATTTTTRVVPENDWIRLIKMLRRRRRHRRR